MTPQRAALLLSAALIAGCGAPASTAASASSSVGPAPTTPPSSASVSLPMPSASTSAAAVARWSFEDEETGKPPAGFKIFVGPGAPRTWTVEGRQAPHSGQQVLGIYRAHARDARPTALVLPEPRLDTRVSVWCWMESPRSDSPERLPNPTAACGLVARVQDAESYYLAAANAHDDEVSLYAVKAGRRTKLGGAKTAPMEARWRELTLTVQGDELSVSWDGKLVDKRRDKTFTAAGGIGVWTFVNSLTELDDFSAATL